MIVSTGLIALEIVARLNRVSLDLRAQVREMALEQCEPNLNQLLRLCRRCGFKARLKKLKDTDWQKYPLPAVLIYPEGTYGVLLQQAQPGTLLVFQPLAKSPQPITLQELEQAGVVDCLILVPKDSLAQVKFGLKWFWVEIIKYKAILAEIMAASFVVQVLGLITPLFTQIILDKVIVHYSLTTLYVLAVAFIAFMVFEFLLNLARNYVFVHTASKLDAKLGAKLFRHLFALPFAYFEARKVGNIISRIRELDRIREFVTNKLVSVILDTLFSFVFVMVMLLYSVKLTLLVLGFILAIALLYLLTTPSLRRKLEGKFQMSAESNSYLVEAVTGIQTVKSLAIEGTMQKNWEKRLAGYIHSSFKLASLSNVSGAISGLLQKGLTIAVLFVGVELVITKQLTIGQLIAFQMISRQLTSPVIRLVTLWSEFQQVLLAVDKLGDILNHPTEQTSSTHITLPVLSGAIRFEKVAFRYRPDAPLVLSQLSFAVQPGTSIGLVGRSGSGKSTVAKLVQKLYVPDDGAIFIDDIDIKHLNPAWLRNIIGVVLQENYLFSGTIKENLLLTRPDAPIEEMLGAARLAGAHEFISQLPEGYDTLVGERGSTLSGGQKQRIAIARALISDPRIIIFDEATSALDYESERIIKENLARIKQGRTLLVIAHRLSTVIDCDTIIVLDKGQILEQGTHQELMARNGYYKYLHAQQEALIAH